MSRNTCPNCGLKEVQNVGNPNRDRLIILEKPDFNDVKTGVLLSSTKFETDWSNTLHTELNRVGIRRDDVYVVSYWSHAPSKECDREIHTERTAQYLLQYPKVLMMGSEPTRAFFDEVALDICGLKKKLPQFPKTTIVPCISLSALALGNLGELRYAMKTFSEL